MGKGCMWIVGILLVIIIMAEINTGIENGKTRNLPLYEKTEDVQIMAGTLIKEHLRDPDSYEFIDMREEASSTQGEKLFVVTYRAKNGFGGYNVGEAVLSCDKDNLTFISAE